ncbi:ABC transporter G family member 25-like [Chenopodium quinoa]|uniref:ABC transporter domain-containing protein n=1 Tax=Chenopodium quinoa TaxID=63459 RepID=A0A803L029_CHEQI|nr:ABC transporter G family member 25-like [Chenopodium quinoa]
MSVFYEDKPPNQINGNTLTQCNDFQSQSPSLLCSSYPITLKFMNISYKVKVESNEGGSNMKTLICGGGSSTTTSSSSETTTTMIQERTILNEISGIASPGEIVAVLGPSGSGKSTLLNALAGRIRGHALTGSILANDKKLTKQIQKRTGFVTQDDVLYPHLTVRETLLYCALLRLPNTLTKNDKINVVESVMGELGLHKCGDTIIGNTFIRGVSGGERKRVCIAHEMLVNPSLLILDEPTSGLDSTAAHRLVLTLQGLARKGGKTIITSIHQPSSRVYQMFDSVLVLCDGRPIYFGKGHDSMSYFQSVGFEPSFPMNPADFLLDLANGISHQPDGVNESNKANTKQALVTAYNTVLAPRVKTACLDNTSNNKNTLPKNTVVVSRRSAKQYIKNGIFSWFSQFSILLQRSLKERRHESFNSLRVSQVIAAALLAGMMWWKSDYRDVQDRLGLLYFISIFWGVFPSFNAVFAFPQDRSIFVKERASGMYSLSSYFMARIIGDLPLELILPSIFLTLVYWMTGLRPELWTFLQSLGVIIGYVLVAQGLGLALGAIIMDAKRASTIVTIIMLACVLTGGFYVHKLPSCLSWIKYASLTFYCYRLLIDVQYNGGERISRFFGCSSHHSMNVASCKFIEEDIVGQISPLASVGVMLIMFVGFRLLAYIALRRMKV